MALYKYVYYYYYYYYTSGFVDDVMFSHDGANGPESKTTHVSSSSSGGSTGGRSLPSPIASCLIIDNTEKQPFNSHYAGLPALVEK